MLHDPVTNTASQNFFNDDIIMQNQSNVNRSGRDVLSVPRRVPAGRMPKAELSERSMLSPANGESRWRFNGNGQLVDSATASWDLAEEIGKMHIGANGDGDAQIHTPPPLKTNVAHFHETSPLETSSEASLESGSSNALDHPINLANHSRESSADTSMSAASSASQTLRGSPVTPLRIGAVGEARNRPHSYSGGISAADLTRLQQADGSPPNKGDSWASSNGTPERQPVADQPTYPSLTLQTSAARPQEHQQVIQGFPVPRGDEFSVEYQLAQRQFGAMPQLPGMNSAAAGTAYAQGRPGGVPGNVATNIPYRQAPRGFTPQLPTVLQSPTNFGYPAPPPPPMSLNSAQQQLYEIMLPTPPLDNPAMARLQQQHNVFRGAHQHSPSDAASVRDPAALALINNNMQAFAASQMYPPALAPPAAALSMFASQFYGAPQDAYPSPELAAVQMMARLQSQYTGPYSLPIAGQNVGVANPANASTLSGNTGTNTGPSANNRKLGLYKTELCRSWEEKGSCRYGAKCQFAHGEEELRKVTRHPKYKTEICRTFWVSGSCPYGKRCCFIHTELPASGAPPGADGAPPPQNPNGRDRSGSTNSDPNEVPTSLLARITAKRTQEGSINSNTGSVSTTPPSGGFQLGGRPGSLHVDTSVVNPAASSKQNKSAYPTFAHNGMLMPASEEVTARSPGPVTAGPDFGRHSSSRLDIVGTQRIGKNTGTNSNVRHSFNGSDLQLDFSTTPTAANMSSQLGTSDANKGASRINGHARSGSTGNWGNTARGSHLTAYPLSSIPGGELKASSPWAEFSVGSRLAEKNWV